MDYAKIQLQVQTVGQSGLSSWVSVSEIQTDSFYDSGSSSPIQTEPAASQIFTGQIEETRYLNKGDKLRLNLLVRARTAAYPDNEIRLYLFGSSTPTSVTTSDNANGQYTIAIDPNNVAYGQTYNLTDVMNPDYKQIDFIKGIAHAYNLQMTTDESTKTVYIEPFDSFYKPYKDAIDWTGKLSRADEITDKWIENDLKRSLVFKYKSDNADAKVKARGEVYFDDVEDEYPYRETLPDTFEKGDSTTSPILSYGNVFVRDYYDATGVYTAYQAGKGLYDTYYRNMVEMLKRSPRLRTVSLDLKVTDIINLDFRKLVYIDGVYWRINRVVDYMPNKNSTTKVELIEWFQIGVFAATAPSFGSSGNNSNWGVGGSYTVSTSDEAEPINSF